MAELRDVFRDAQALVEGLAASGGPSAQARPPTQSAIDAAISAFTRTWRWRVSVPGTHPSGITYDQLLIYLEGAGFDFLAETVQLRQAVNRDLRVAFRGARSIPDTPTLRRAAAPLMAEFMELRFNKGNGDISMPRLAPPTLRAKARKGRAGYPIGVDSGALRARFSRVAQIIFL